MNGIKIMNTKIDHFHQFEHEGWQRAAAKYDSAWTGLVRPFIPYLLDAAKVVSGTQLLDVACGTGYVTQAAHNIGATATGVDFSSEMIRIASKKNPQIEFHLGDAQSLLFDDSIFDSVVMNFGLLHLSRPKAAFAEAIRVLRPGGWYGFTIWASPDKNPGARIVSEAIANHANQINLIPEGPDYFGFGTPEECSNVLGHIGFDPASLFFRSVTIKWKVPSVSHLFECERDVGVRNAAVLGAQKPEILEAIRNQIENSVRTYAKDDDFVIPFTAHVIAVKAL